MARRKDVEGEKTSVEIVKLDVVKELCAARRMSLKEYLNFLIKEDIMRQGEYFSNRYFKEMAGRM